MTSQDEFGAMMAFTLGQLGAGRSLSRRGEAGVSAIDNRRRSAAHELRMRVEMEELSLTERPFSPENSLKWFLLMYFSD